jgi:subtilisin family serine protease
MSKKRSSPLPTAPVSSATMIEPLEERLLMRASSAPWGAWNQFIYQDAAAASFPTLTGRGETVAVLDTGISNVPSLKGKIIGGYNFVNNNTNYNDTTGHGTSVAGVIAASQYTFQGRKYQGVAPGVKLAALRIDDGTNTPTDANIQAALQWVLDNSARYNIVAVNISEGGLTQYGGNHTSIYSPQLAELTGHGIFVAAAAGNENAHNGVDYPAADPNVFAVGSSNLYDQPSSFTNTGPNLNLLAPGEYVVTPTITNGRSGFLNGTGTSYSAPIATATAALIRQVSNTFSVQAIRNIEQSTPFFDTDPANGLSFPRLDLFNALYVATHQVGAAHLKVFR